MPYNGSGTFNRVYNWTNDANNNIDIEASRMDTEDNGFATGLSNCLCKDGQQTATANQPMGGYYHTGVGTGTTRTNYASVGQIQDGTTLWGGTSGGAAGAQTLTLSPAITAYVAGQSFNFICGFNPTTAVTMNINGVGAITIKKRTPEGLVGIITGDMLSGTVYTITYDGTYFQLTKEQPTPLDVLQRGGD